jgi:hypothetical protein
MWENTEMKYMLLEYRGYNIKKAKSRRTYECEELAVKANNLKDMIRVISKIKKSRILSPEVYLKGKRRTLIVTLNPYDAEIIMDGLQEIKRERGLNNKTEVLKFLISLYKV